MQRYFVIVQTCLWDCVEVFWLLVCVMVQRICFECTMFAWWCLCLCDVVCVRDIIYRGLISLCNCVQMFVSLWLYESLCLCHRVQVFVWLCKICLIMHRSLLVWLCSYVWLFCLFATESVCMCACLRACACVRRSMTDYEGGLSLKRSEALWTTIINSNLCLLCVCLSNESSWVTSWDDWSK